MIKKWFSIIAVFIFVFAMTGCGQKEQELSDALKFKQEYENLNDTKREKDGKVIRSINIPEDNPFVYKTADDIIKMMDEGESFVVYFGFADCPWCRSVLPSLIDVAQDLSLSSIYYVDVSDIRDVLEVSDDGSIQTVKKGSKGYYSLIQRLDSVLDDYILTDANGEEVSASEKRIFAPNVVSVVKGKPQVLEDGIGEGLTDPYMEITDDIRNDTYHKFKCSMQCVVDNSNSCSNKKAC